MARAGKEKSIFTDEYAALLGLLRETRKAAGMTQARLAEEVGQGQAYISKVEHGELRLDVIQLRTLCHALGTTLPEFIARLEQRLAAKKPKK